MRLYVVMSQPFNSRTENTTDIWETPPEFFALIDGMFHFTLDPCATKENAKCALYYTPEDDGLSKSWEGKRAFVNPPYNAIDTWTEKCCNEGVKDDTLVALLTKPATETKRWHKYIMDARSVYFITPRINFLLGGKRPSHNGSNFPSILVIFERHNDDTQYMSLVWKTGAK